MIELCACIVHAHAVTHTCRYLQTYPQMALMMENIIRVYGLLYGGLTGDTVEEEQEIIDMVERNFEDDLEDADQDTSSPLAQAQEQVRHLNVQGYILYGWKIWQGIKFGGLHLQI